MEKIILLLVAGVLLLLLIRLMLLPVKLIFKLLINGTCGVICLWLVNVTAGLTGFSIPVNPLTAVIAGGLGLPGLVLLALAQVIL